MSKNRKKALWTQNGQRRGEAEGKGEVWRVPTHTCAAPGSCSGRPGVGRVGSGSSADRPAWLNWGPTARHSLWQGPCEDGGEELVTYPAPCPPPASLSWESRPAASHYPEEHQRLSKQSPFLPYQTDEKLRLGHQEAHPWPHRKEKMPSLLSGGLLP